MNLQFKYRTWPGLLAAILGMALVILGMVWVTWQLWCFVLGELWPSGPAPVTSPSFGVFLAGWFLVGLIGRNLFGSRT